jgi:hypothetical protein
MLFGELTPMDARNPFRLSCCPEIIVQHFNLHAFFTISEYFPIFLCNVNLPPLSGQNWQNWGQRDINFPERQIMLNPSPESASNTE